MAQRNGLDGKLGPDIPSREHGARVPWVSGRPQRGTITVRTSQTDADAAVVAIADTGAASPRRSGIGCSIRFFTTKEIGRGTGQGLALARAGIVDRHGGTIDFETQLGKGTTFYVRVPIRGRPVGHSA
jgi:signal transduction histidine kinase